ncbi:MAG: 50S ribosomal protein L21 [Cyanobacteriota/Melainabacteria group bacterium]|nr:50S ribosomal protein L21 [bacterium]MCA9816513.1 50S ribosomal protein L21 [Cyanobacteria bacterium HKST-UBA01]MCB9469685.1 50S ribosomal protein L21 [Candidatus Obscuribacterales bacterium]
MMFAIVEAGGRQFKLEPGRFIDIDRTDDQEGADCVFDKVLMLVDGDKSTVGQPYVEGAAVKGKVISNLKENEVTGRITSSIRSKKIIVYKQKPKKGTRVKHGHRTEYTRVMIDSISVKDKTVASAPKA